jgi:hypothetical protein
MMLPRLISCLLVVVALVPVLHAEEEPLPGIVLPRPGGGFINFRIEENSFQVHFLDEEKEPALADRDRGLVRYRPAMRREERVVLSPDPEGTMLTNPLFIRPPYAFHVILALFAPGTGDPETYTFQFNQP